MASQFDASGVAFNATGGFNEGGTSPDANVTPVARLYSYTFTAPTVNAAALVTATAQLYTVTLTAPVVAAAALITPTVLAGTATFVAPSVTGGAAVTPVARLYPATLTAPVVAGSAIASPASSLNPDSAPAGRVSFPAVTTRGSAIATPGALLSATTFSAPTLVTDALFTPATGQYLTTFVAPSVNASAYRTPSTFAGQFAPVVRFGAVSVQANAAVTPASLVCAVTLTVPTVTVAGDAIVNPNALACTTVFAGPSVDAAATTTPIAQPYAVASVVPSVNAAARANPAAFGWDGSGGSVTGRVMLQAPTVNADAAVTPSSLTAVATLSVPSLSTDTTLTGNTLAATTTFTAPTVTADTGVQHANVLPASGAYLVKWPPNTQFEKIVVRASASVAPASYLYPATSNTATVTIGGSTAVTPSTLACTAAVQSVVVSAAAQPSVAAVAVRLWWPSPGAGFPAIVVRGAAGVSPSVQAAQVTFLVPSVLAADQGNATVTPVSFHIAVTMVATTVGTGVTLTPTVLVVEVFPIRPPPRVGLLARPVRRSILRLAGTGRSKAKLVRSR